MYTNNDCIPSAFEEQDIVMTAPVQNVLKWCYVINAVSLVFIISLQAGLIVKLLMKLSGQMTPNDKSIMDKYAYGWKPAAVDPVQIPPTDPPDCRTQDKEQSHLTSALFCIFGLLKAFATSHCVFSQVIYFECM